MSRYLIMPSPAQLGTQHVTSGLVGYWDAGNSASYSGSGTTWTDLAGNSNGTLTNGPTYSADRGGGIVFDGSNEFVTHASSSSLYMSGTASYTLEAFVFHPTISTTKAHGYMNRDDSGNGFNLYMSPISSGTQLQWVTERRGSGAYAFARAVTSRTDYQNRWVHVCGTYDGTTLRVYLNSVLGVDTGTQTGNLNNTTKTLEIGRVAGSWGAMIGTISVARIYNRTLSAAEITQNFDAFRGRFGL